MGVSREDLSARCPGCNEQMDPDMAFCMRCGYAVRATGTQGVQTGSMPEARSDTRQSSQAHSLSQFQAQSWSAADFQSRTADTQKPGRVCPSCGKFDPLSSRFCVHCGHGTEALGPGLSGPVAVFGQPVTNEQYGLMLGHTEELVSGRPGPPGLTLWMGVGAAVAGAVVGLLLSFLVVRTPFEDMLVRRTWPAEGLVIYASHSGAQVTIENVAQRTFTIGKLGPHGELVVPDLAPGTYRVTITLTGYASRVEDVEVLRDKVAVLGYPRRLELTHSG